MKKYSEGPNRSEGYEQGPDGATKPQQGYEEGPGESGRKEGQGPAKKQMSENKLIALTLTVLFGGSLVVIVAIVLLAYLCGR